MPRSHQLPGTVCGSLIEQRIGRAQVSLHPEISYQCPFSGEFGNAGLVDGPLAVGVSRVVPPQHPHFIRPQCVQEEGRVGGDQQLRTRNGSPAFLGQFRQQARMQEVLRLFDPDKGRRDGIVEQYEIGQHLQRAVGKRSAPSRVW